MSFKFDPINQTVIEVKEATKFQRFVRKRRTLLPLGVLAVAIPVILTIAYFNIRAETLKFEKDQRDRGNTFESPYPHFDN